MTLVQIDCKVVVLYHDQLAADLLHGLAVNVISFKTTWQLSMTAGTPQWVPPQCGT